MKIWPNILYFVLGLFLLCYDIIMLLAGIPLLGMFGVPKLFGIIVFIYGLVYLLFAINIVKINRYSNFSLGFFSFFLLFSVSITVGGFFEMSIIELLATLLMLSFIFLIIGLLVARINKIKK